MEEKQVLLRGLPKVDEVLLDERLFLFGDTPRNIIVETVREVIEKFRNEIISGERKRAIDKDEVFLLIEKLLNERSKKNLRRVLNATGVVLHTNLGRARLSRQAYHAMAEIADSYSNLEYDLKEGERGSRHDIISLLIRKVTGAQAAIAVNNNAAATMLVLAAMARGKEVIISRGELVEVGGSFRIPDVMSESGAILREVGATNKTRISDYRAAFDEEKTAVFLKVHTSNYRIVGFTEDVGLQDMVALGKEYKTPVIYDMGSGLISDLSRYGLHEPTVSDALKLGVDLVLFSGDKLLGGPQAGIIIGKKEYIVKIKKHPLARAFRVDKFTLAALEATFRSYLDGDNAIRDIPTLRMICESKEELYKKANTLKSMIEERCPNLLCEIETCIDQVGGGSAPTDKLYGYALGIVAAGIPSQKIERRLRKADIPMIVRLNHDKIFVNVRTLEESELELAVEAICFAVRGE